MIYYVSNIGEDISTDENKPGNIYKTLNYLIDNGDGDEVICLPGEYELVFPIILVNHNEEKIYTLRGIDFEHRPIFNFTKQKTGRNGVILNNNNICVKDIIIIGSGYKGLVAYGSNCLIERVESSFNQDSGIQLRNELNIVKDCDSHHNFGYKNKFTIATYGFSSDGFSDKLYAGKGNTFINCRSWSNTDDGFDFFGKENNSIENPTKLINCWAFFNGRSRWNMEKHPRYETDKKWLDEFKNGVVVQGRWRKYVKATLNEFPAFGNGNGFKMSGKDAYNNIELENCIAAGNKFKGFDQNSNTGNMTIINGISYKNHHFNFGFGENIDKNAKLKIENCVAGEGQNYISWRIKNPDIIDSSLDSSTLKFDIYELMQPRNSDGSLPAINIKK